MKYISYYDQYEEHDQMIRTSSTCSHNVHNKWAVQNHLDYKPYCFWMLQFSQKIRLGLGDDTIISNIAIYFLDDYDIENFSNYEISANRAEKNIITVKKISQLKNISQLKKKH